MPNKDGFNILNVFSRVNDSGFLPDVTEFNSRLQTFHVVILWIACIASAGVLFISLIQIIYVVMFVKQENLRSNIYFMISMPPVTCLCSMIGMFIPRSAQFLYAVNVSYYMLCLYMVVSLMYAMFGSKRLMVKYLHENGIPIRLAVPPYFTWLTCLPVFGNSRKNVTTIECLILQTVIVRMVSQITELVVFYELEHRNHVFFSISNGLGLISMFVAFYFVYVMIYLGKDRLAPYNFSAMFRLHDLAQTLCSIQKFGADVLIKMKMIKGSTEFLPATGTAMFYFNFVLCVEMFVLNCLALYMLRPSRTILFNSVEEDVDDSPAFIMPGVSTSMEQQKFLDQHTETRTDASFNSNSAPKKSENASHEILAAPPSTPTPMMVETRKEASNPPKRSQEYSALLKQESREVIIRQ